MTVVGGTLSVPSGKTGLTIKAANVTVNGMTLAGANTAYAAIWATSASNVTVTKVHINGFVYAGVMTISVVGGSITNSSITNIGINYVSSMNAYGIALSDSGGVPSSGITVSGNTDRRRPDLARHRHPRWSPPDDRQQRHPSHQSGDLHHRFRKRCGAGRHHQREHHGHADASPGRAQQLPVQRSRPDRDRGRRPASAAPATCSTAGRVATISTRTAVRTTFTGSVIRNPS